VSCLWLGYIYGRVSYVVRQVGESQCTDLKVLQAVADTLKECVGKRSHLFFLRQVVYAVRSLPSSPFGFSFCLYASIRTPEYVIPVVPSGSAQKCLYRSIFVSIRRLLVEDLEGLYICHPVAASAMEVLVWYLLEFIYLLLRNVI